MKFYNYLLFRLHTILSKNSVYDAKGVIFLTTIISTLFLYLTLYLIWHIINPFIDINLNEVGVNKSIFIIILLFFSILNYYLFVKSKNFLNYGFKEDKLGGFLIFIYLIVVFVILILFANKNREKIRNEIKKNEIENLNTVSR